MARAAPRSGSSFTTSRLHGRYLLTVTVAGTKHSITTHIRA